MDVLFLLLITSYLIPYTYYLLLITYYLLPAAPYPAMRPNTAPEVKPDPPG